MKDAAAVGQHDRGFHVVAAQSVLHDERTMNEQRQDGDKTADRAAQAPADCEDIEERDDAEGRVPEPQTELVVRKHAQANGQRDDPELERRLLEERLRLGGAALGREPVAVLEDSLDGVGVDGLVVTEIRPAEPDKQRPAEK